jgi:hypothetical protein
VRAPPTATRRRDPGAGGNLTVDGRDADRPDRGADGFGDLNRAVGVRRGEQHQEFLAAVASNEVAFPHRETHRDADGREDFVAAVVAVEVVDLFEMVQIEQDGGQRGDRP